MIRLLKLIFGIIALLWAIIMITECWYKCDYFGIFINSVLAIVILEMLKR